MSTAVSSITICSWVRNGFFHGHWYLKMLHHTWSTQDHGENPQVPRDKGFQPGAILPSRGHADVSGNTFVVTAGWPGTTGTCSGAATKHTTMYSVVPTTKNHQAPNVSSAGVEKLPWKDRVEGIEAHGTAKCKNVTNNNMV